MNIAIANRLVELRSAKGWTQEELAEKLDVSRQAVSKWERAESSPELDKLMALSRLYGISLDSLLDTGFRPEASFPPEESGSCAQGKNGGSAEEREPGDPSGAYPASPAPPRQASGVAVAALSAGGREGLEILEALAADDAPESVEPARRSAEWILGSFPYPIAVALVYLLLGFIGNWWHPGWLLFLTVPLYYLMGAGIDCARSAGSAWGRIHAFLLGSGLFPVLIVALYLTMGVLWGLWHPGWCIFLLIPLLYCLPEPR
ncbi:MAG TPA: helix-turn-helix transcriptional regulator [Firmicutes bacterium]|nr:helix-turn-helix transcriptional regulator [Bacillota bacterium]